MLLPITLAITALLRFHMSIIRFFDPDEFAHLHWTYLLLQGDIPYKDIFIYHIPIFQLFLIPIIALPPSPTLLLVSRIVMFFLLGVLLLCIYILSVKITGNKRVGLLAALIASTFPIIFDKLIEIRPDTLMMVLLLTSILLVWKTKKHTSIFLSGMCFGLSILTLPKVLFALPAIVYLIGFSIPALVPFFVGLFIPAGIFAIYLMYLGIAPLALHAILDLSRLILVERTFSAWMGFIPWPSVYVDHGNISLPWIVSTGYWILGVIGLFYVWRISRRATVFFLLYFLFGLITLFQFPSPHTQYHIPLAILVSITAAVVINTLPKALLALSLVTILISFGMQYHIRIKNDNTNYEQLAVISDMLNISKPDETVFDMVGSYVFRPDGFPICCHRYGAFLDKLNPPPPLLREELVVRKTKFIILDRSGFSLWVTPPDDLAFLAKSYLPSEYPKIYTLGLRFICERSLCTQIDLNNMKLDNHISNNFSVIISEKYRISTTPPNTKISIDGSPILDNNEILLDARIHTLSVPQNVQEITIQLAR